MWNTDKTADDRKNDQQHGPDQALKDRACYRLALCFKLLANQVRLPRVEVRHEVYEHLAHRPSADYRKRDPDHEVDCRADATGDSSNQRTVTSVGRSCGVFHVEIEIGRASCRERV